MMLRHVLWSALVGPLAGALAMLGVTIVTLPFLRPTSVQAMPGLEALPSMIAYMVAAAYFFGIWPCLAFGAANGVASRFVSGPALYLVAAATGALTALVFVLILGSGRVASPYEMLLWAVCGSLASIVSAAVATKRS